ncbi:MAG: HD domain-containing protein [Chlorobiales bacterium]|nr:HD domain-containing protein [Chlorobiales bacterium]
MNVIPKSILLDELFSSYQQLLGVDYDAYKNHCLRVFNFCCALAGDCPDAEDKIAIATFFHDIGIWTDNTFDYLVPSQLLARRYLEQTNRVAWGDEIEAMIGEHHKLTKYEANSSWLVEPFRKADWIDVSGGLLRFRLLDDFVTDVLYAFPNAGFHKKLVELSIKRLKTHPFSPLPMLKL